MSIEKHFISNKFENKIKIRIVVLFLFIYSLIIRHFLTIIISNENSLILKDNSKLNIKPGKSDMDDSPQSRMALSLDITEGKRITRYNCWK